MSPSPLSATLLFKLTVRFAAQIFLFFLTILGWVEFFGESLGVELTVRIIFGRPLVAEFDGGVLGLTEAVPRRPSKRGFSFWGWTRVSFGG